MSNDEKYVELSADCHYRMKLLSWLLSGISTYVDVKYNVYLRNGLCTTEKRKAVSSQECIYPFQLEGYSQ